MVNSAKEARTKENVLDAVLKVEKELEKTMKQAVALCNAKVTVPGKWSSVQIKIVNELMQAVSEMQTIVAMLPDFNAMQELQNIHSYLGDQFRLLTDITSLTTMLAAKMPSGESAAVLDEINDVCETIFKRIKDIRSAASKVSAPL